MNKLISAIGLSLFLLLGSAPAVLLAHEGHDHGDRDSGYREREDSGRYDPQNDDDRWEDEEEKDDDTYRPSSRHYPPPDREPSAPREQGSRPW